MLHRVTFLCDFSNQSSPLFTIQFGSANHAKSCTLFCLYRRVLYSKRLSDSFFSASFSGFNFLFFCKDFIFFLNCLLSSERSESPSKANESSHCNSFPLLNKSPVAITLYSFGREMVTSKEPNSL